MLTPPHGEAEVRAAYGDIKVVSVKGALQIVSPPQWESRCMITVSDLPGFENRKLYINRLIEEPLRAALTGCIARRPDYLIRTMGCFNVRLSRTTSHLSLHAFGAAVDINSDTNPLIHLKNLTDPAKYDMPNEWVEEFERCGFTWGGKFQGLTKDFMHMQYASGF